MSEPGSPAGAAMNGKLGISKEEIEEVSTTWLEIQQSCLGLLNGSLMLMLSSLRRNVQLNQNTRRRSKISSHEQYGV